MLSDDVAILTSLLEKSGATHLKEEETLFTAEEPISRLISELDADPSDIKRLVGYKEGMVQIWQASQSRVTDAMGTLLYAYDRVLVNLL